MAVAALLLTSASTASAQAQTPPSVEVQRPLDRSGYGQIDFGGRFTNVSGDAARYQRYRDLRDGVFLDIPMYHRETDNWWTTIVVRNAGYRDQRYLFTAARPGKVKLRFIYDQTPTFISNDTLTPYAPLPQGNGFFGDFGGALTLPDSLQATVQADPAMLRQQIERQAQPFSSRIRRDSLGFDLAYDVNPNWRAKVRYLSTRKQGTLPFGAAFGFNLVVEVPLPVDTMANDFGASMEWSNPKGMFRVGWDGSWFNQNVPSFTWDNPTRLTDQTYDRAYVAGDGTSQGRMTEWPSNRLSYFNVGAAYRLPSRTSVSGTLAIGRSTQDEALVPFTINTAIPPLNDTSSLDRRNADAKANLAAATLNFLSRGSSSFSVSARYRFNRYDNQTPHFEREEYVRFDNVAEEGGSPEFQGYTRNYFDADVSYTAIPYTSLKVGYGFYGADFAERVYHKSRENTFRASVDVVGSPLVSFRSQYEHGQRRGDGLHEEVLEEAGEHPGMRHYDVADRNRDRIMVVANLTPPGDFGVNALVAWTKDTFLAPEVSAVEHFGLLNHRSRTFGVGFDYLPGETINVGASYNYDQYDSLQQSRNGSPGPQFDDPTRNWNTDENQAGHSFIAYVDLLKLVEKTELRFNYNYSKYNGSYVYSVGPGYAPSPSEPGGVVQLPELTSEEQRLGLDLRYWVRRQVAIGLAYWFDDYKVEDFALGPPGSEFVSVAARPPITEEQSPTSTINGILLNYLYRPYTAHTAFVRLTYLF